MANDRVQSTLSTGPAVKCMKLLLSLFNIIFVVIGLGCLGVGIYMKVGVQQYLQLSRDYYHFTPYIVIAFGVLMFIVGSMACCCTYKGQAIPLYIYSGFVIIIFVLQLAAGICSFFYRPVIQDGFESGMKDALKAYPNLEQKTIDDLQEQLQCCGVNDYKDWFSTEWSRDQNMYAVPVSCCVDVESCEHKWSVEPIGNSTISGIYNEGCYAIVSNFLNANFGKIGGAAIGLSFLMFFGAILSCCLAKNINKAKYEQVA